MTNDEEIRRADEESEMGTRLAYFLIGGGIGAIVALLFAPKSGHELRGDIADVTRKGIDRTRETATQVGTRAGEYYEVTRDRASHLYASASTKAGDVADVAREVASRKKDQIAAAFEAGKEAYDEEKRRTDLAALSEGVSFVEDEKRSN